MPRRLLVLALLLPFLGCADDPTTPEPEPEPNPDPPEIVGFFHVLTAGIDHTCALDGEGVAYCWGGNVMGQLGTGDVAERHTPTAVATGARFVAIEAGAWHTCALTGEGAIWCWGMGAGGRLGIAESELAVCSSFFPAPCSRTPRPIETELVFESISVLQNTCGVTTDGEAWCLGYDDFGQLGYQGSETCGGTFGAAPCSSTPIRIGAGTDWRSIDAGWATTCGIDVAGAGYCWGYGQFGALGDGDASIDGVPQRVAVVDSFTVISHGASHSCALGDGAAWCWGLAQLGQSGTDDGLDACPNFFGDEIPCALTPVRVAGQREYVAVGASISENVIFAHGCALDADGAAWCWGGNLTGQLGAETTEECFEPGHDTMAPCSRTPVAVQGGRSFVRLAVGGAHTCALTATGEAWCWGENFFGQLGNGSSRDHSFAPVLAAAPATEPAAALPATSAAGATSAATAGGHGLRLGTGTR